ncbi:MAG: histidine kinase [Ferruginibacter sp.]|nr:histidine kinase [Ferruginibacter sp.]
MPVKHTLHITVFTCLFLSSLYGKAQSFRFTQLTTHHGLPIDNVYAAAQDDDGFMWFGTDFGIARYDGYRFTVYGKQNRLAARAVTDIVYAGGDSLIFIAYPFTIQALHKNGRINTLADTTGFALQQVTRHQQQYYFYKRLYNLYGVWENGKYTKCNADSVLGIKGTNINSIVSLGQRGIAFCTSNGLFIKNGTQIQHLLQNSNVQFAVYKGQKTILAVADGKLHQADGSFVFKQLPVQFPRGFFVYHAAEEKNGTVWFRGLDKGIYRLYQDELQEMSDRIGMENRAVNEFFYGADGNFWFCTDGSGILLKKNSAFINYETTDGLANNKILKLLRQKNELLIGTANGLSALADNKITTIGLPKTGDGLKYVYQLFPVKENITGISIDRTFAFSSNGGKIDNLVKDFKIHHRSFRAFNPTFAWQQDELNSWTVGYSTLTHIQKENDQFTPNDLSAFKVRKAYCMTSYDNKLWLGTDAGIIFIDQQNISKKDSIATTKLRQVLCFLTDKKGRLWIATDLGLFLYHKNEFTPKKTGGTMGSNYCTGLTEDNQGRIWVSTWDGIFVFDDVKTGYYNTNDGLPSKTANCILFDSVTRVLFVGTDNGLGVMDKSLFTNNSKISKVFISCSITGSADDSMIINGSSLSPDANDLNFYLSFPYYQGTSEVYYEYRLDGGPWSATTNPAILISDIASGKHQFYARAKINDQLISNGETSFTFTIKAPFYKTWWFWLILVLLVQFLLFMAYNYFSRKAKEKKMALQSQQADYASLKQQAFTQLMNPHFIFNALNSVQHYVNKQDRQSANKYLSDFATLIRRSFDASQKSFVTLEEELETIRLYLQLESMRFAGKFEYRINVDESADDEDWMLPSMMLQPFLENAILHGLMPLDEKGLLTIDVAAQNNCLRVIIADNGIGIEKSKALRSGTKHKSKGMQLITERLELLGKLSKEPVTLAITASNPDAANPGTKITLIIPQEVYEVFQQQRNQA